MKNRGENRRETYIEKKDSIMCNNQESTSWRCGQRGEWVLIGLTTRRRTAVDFFAVFFFAMMLRIALW